MFLGEDGNFGRREARNEVSKEKDFCERRESV